MPRAAIAALRAFWRTRMGKLTVVLLVLALWRPGFLLVPAVYYGIKLLRVGMRRLLYSVRAKLAAFYVFAALLPVLLFAIVLFFVLYVVLGQVSARVIESRLERQVEWAEQRAQRLESEYWRARSSGRDRRAALERALDTAYGDVAAAGFGCWAVEADGRLVTTRGEVRRGDLRLPAWLAERRFVGIAVRDSTGGLDLRTRLRLTDDGGAFDVGSAIPIDTELLNRGLAGATDEVRGGLGSPNRSLRECDVLPDSVVIRQGIVGYISEPGTVGVIPAQGRLPDAKPRPSADDGTRAGLRARRADGGRLAPDSTFREVPGLAPDSLRLRSRVGLLHWAYLGYPVDWETGGTAMPGPTIGTFFSVEGTARELLRTGLGVTPVILILLSIVVGVLLLLQIVASLQGFAYARAISNSVAKLDRGVRAIEAGDFGHRIAPRERDQLGALALSFNHMSGRLQGLLEERANHQAMERELAIARDVQAKLFPEHTPWAPFLEAAGVCVPARTVSGDYYDFIPVPGGYDAVIADVSGKGMSAALLMASLHSALRGLYLRQGRDALPDAAEVVTRLNQHLNQYIEPSRFVTLFLARYRGDGELLYCNAGHNPAALVREGHVEWLTSGGLMLGPFPDLVYEAAKVAVKPGDLLCLYTDGVTEAESPSGEQYGEDRLTRALQGAFGQHPRDVMVAIQESVSGWRGDREPGDDLTLLLLRITG